MALTPNFLRIFRKNDNDLRRLKELDPEIIRQAVEVLRQEIPSDVMMEIHTQRKEHGPDWYLPYHFYWGMHVRNTLRDHGLIDKYLPDNNWDDYTCGVIEVAAGIRDEKTYELVSEYQ